MGPVVAPAGECLHQLALGDRCGPGHWRWLEPDGTEVAREPPPPLQPDDDTGTIAERQARICDAAIARTERLGVT